MIEKKKKKKKREREREKKHNDNNSEALAHSILVIKLSVRRTEIALACMNVYVVNITSFR